jgi:hypothetical protein
MNSLTIPQSEMRHESKLTVPVTKRGRALYTMDWFINGKPVLQYHDNSLLTLERILLS